MQIENLTPIGNLTEFEFRGVRHDVAYQKEYDVDGAPGAHCAEYKILGQEGKIDLGVVDMEPGAVTPLQRVVEKDGKNYTFERIAFGKGKLWINRKDGTVEAYEVDGSERFMMVVGEGDIMQWSADENGPRLRFYEVCEPPYEDGRFETVEYCNFREP